MFSLFRTLSVRSFTRHWFRVAAIVLSIALGVATLVATRALNRTMGNAAVFAANPTTGVCDLVVANGDLTVPRALEAELRAVPGVLSAKPRIYENAYLPEHGDQPVLLMFVDLAGELKTTGPQQDVELSRGTELAFVTLGLLGTPAVVGKQLADSLPAGTTALGVRRGKASPTRMVSIAGSMNAKGNAAVLAGNVMLLDLSAAPTILGIDKTQVRRFDIVVVPGTNPAQVRDRIQGMLAGRAEVRTFQEQSDITGNVLTIMQTGFYLCGLAALVVGMFLVYNALSVTVAERRHEIGILLSVGATRGQILRLFAGEAVAMGFVGGLVGLPLGIGLAKLALLPVQDVLQNLIGELNARTVEIDGWLLAVGMLAGISTTVLASLIPAWQASRENPACAVRRVPKQASAANLLWQVAVSVLLVLVGTAMILGRERLPASLGSYGGLMLVMVGALVASPFCAALGAKLLQPLLRNYGSIEWRLAADNIVRSPGRTGLVIGALAAGVSLVVQTAGVIRSNRQTIRDWIDSDIGSDVILSAGTPVGAGGQTHPIPPSLVAEINRLPGVEITLPVRLRKVVFQGTPIMLMAADADLAFEAERKRLAKPERAELYRLLSETENGVIASENLAVRAKLQVGDVISLPGLNGQVDLRVLGIQADLTWGLGTIMIHRRDYLRHWQDDHVDVLDVYLHDPQAATQFKEVLLAKFGATHGLFPMTRNELKAYTDQLIEQVYSIAYAQQIVVMLVAALGVVTALVISVLQRRRELGMLRAIGASRGQVIHTVLAEACLMGLLGAVIGALVGIPLEWYVLNVVIREETGLTFPLILPWREALLVIAAALATATLAGLGPAWIAVRERIPEAIAYE